MNEIPRVGKYFLIEYDRQFSQARIGSIRETDTIGKAYRSGLVVFFVLDAKPEVMLLK